MWKDRAIPVTRHYAKYALDELSYSSTDNMLINNLALSLNDYYWIKPTGSDVKWKDNNLFSNKFEDYFETITLNRYAAVDLKNKTLFNSVTSQGELQKRISFYI